MLAVINMFIFILKYPTLKSAQSDLALLDVAAGHFGHVHLLTSSIISFPFCREVAVVADKALRKAASKTNDDVQEASHPSEPLLDSMLNRSVRTQSLVVCKLLGTNAGYIFRTKRCICRTWIWMLHQKTYLVNSLQQGAWLVSRFVVFFIFI